ncbi:MAG: AmmeMemoRadiSam system protein B [Candidatus Micrarchaeia archaeon]
MATRRYRFAGSFYPQSKAELAEVVRDALNKATVDKAVAEASLAYQVPHAGYEYSGGTAAFTYKALSLSKRVQGIGTIVLVGPNHTGYGMPLAVSGMDWETPLGVAKNDLEFSNALAASEGIEMDDVAHAGEHSLEVQLPFLQYLFGANVAKKYAFICMGDQSIEASMLLFGALQKTLNKLKRSITVIASSDLNHYESAETAAKKDSKLLKAMEEMDPVKLNKLIYELDISACGFGPITVAMMYAKSAGAKKGVILKYSNSGDQTGDYSSVVEYSATAFI